MEDERRDALRPWLLCVAVVATTAGYSCAIGEAERDEGGDELSGDARSFLEKLESTVTLELNEVEVQHAYPMIRAEAVHGLIYHEGLPNLSMSLKHDFRNVTAREAYLRIAQMAGHVIHYEDRGGWGALHVMSPSQSEEDTRPLLE